MVPVSGFYEWQAIEGQKVKQPWYIYRADGKPLLFAGLWSHHAEVGDNYTILTTTPNEFMGRLHTRMPVVLEPESIDA